MQFIQLTIGDKTPVIVNLALVRYFSAATPSGAIVCFDETKSLAVRESYAEILSLLQKSVLTKR